MGKNFLDQLKEMDNYTFTENGAVSLRSTGNKVLDAFGSLAAMKDSSVDTILDTFYAAFNEDKDLAMKLLFYVRDIRGGQGMRRVFRVIARSLAFNHPELVVANLDNFLFFGRGDDVLYLLDTPIEPQVIEWIGTVLECDMINIDDKGVFPSLLAKWLPSENASSYKTKYFAKKIIKGLGISSREYRKMLTKMREKIGIVETLMSQNKWDEIKFDKLPARAAMIYSDAFFRHTENYKQYLIDLANGDAKVNAGSLFPVDIINKIGYHGYSGSTSLSLKDRYLLDAMWKSLPDYFSGKEDSALCMVDTSGSMSGTPVEVAISLGIYCADKCKGPFHGSFLTFDECPSLQTISGDNIIDKVNSLRCINAGNTDIERAFDLILKTAVANNTPQEDLPSKLYIISDMQFDEARGECGYWSRHNKPKPFMQTMKEKYAAAGYTMPALIYWNVRASNCGMFHDTFEGEDCCMVSGYSPSLFKSVIEGTEYSEETVVDDNGDVKVIKKQKIDPINVMLTTLNNERYDRVVTSATPIL